MTPQTILILSNLAVAALVASPLIFFLLKRPKRNKVFVFGSNLAGKHIGGSAREALENWGARTGQGIGRQGNAYAIPTLTGQFEKLTLDSIHEQVLWFLLHALERPHEDFIVVPIGCGIAGFKPQEIAPFFKNATPNVKLPKEFTDVLKAA